jgi:hypothetical protein
MSPRPKPASPTTSNRPSIRVIAILVVLAAVLFGIQYLVGPWWTLGTLGGLVVLAGLLVLFTAKTGKRMARAQLNAQAKRQGIPTTDAAGRPLSEIELQLAVLDTPEARAIKKQLRAMNPRQRAQALRMMQAQADEAARTGVAPVAQKPPRQRYGRPQ